MSKKNRGDKIQLLHKVVTKHFTPVSASEEYSVLEHLLYACCLENAEYDQAEEAFLRLRESFFDWNEIRVTTVSELSETLHNLPDPRAAAVRVKQNLQGLFESRYSFDLDDMLKMNQGKAVKELESIPTMTKFVLGYVVQNALAGHSIPVSKSIMDILQATEIVSEAEAAKGLAPGLERTVPKTKGSAFASCLHQLALAHANSPNSKNTKAIMKEAGAVVKKPEPKKAPKAKPAKSAAKEAKTAPAAKTTTKAPKAKTSTTKAASKAAKPKAAKKAPKKAKAKAAPKSKPKAAKKTTKRKPR